MRATKTVEKFFDKDGHEVEDIAQAARIVVIEYGKGGHVISERVYFQSDA